MIFLAKAIGVLIFALGCVFIVYPAWGKKVAAFWKKGKTVYVGGVIRLVIGVILLIAAAGAKQSITAAILGVVFLASGVLIFAMSLEQTKRLIEFWENQPDLILRLMCIVTIAFGALIFFAF